MRRRAALAVLAVGIVLTACTENIVTTTANQGASAATNRIADEASDRSICEIVFPADLQFAKSQEEADAIAKETDFESVTYCEDGSVLVTMDRDKRKEYVYELASEYERQIEDLTKGNRFPAVQSVSHNGSWTVFTVVVERETEDENALGDLLIRFGKTYQIASGVENIDVTVDFIDQFGNYIGRLYE